MNTQRLNSIILSFVTLFLSGCFSMTPEYLQPDLGFATPEHYQQAAIKSASAAPVKMEDRWWEVFGDPKLNQWVEDALRNNWDLKQAAARILETRYQYFQVRADRFPELDIEGGYDRRKTGGGRIDRDLPGMTVTAVILLLLSVVVHAGWNAISRQRRPATAFIRGW